MKIFTLLIMALFLSMNTIQAKQEIFLMPKEQKIALKRLIKSLENAQQEISIAIYSFTNREIAKAIRDSASKGVRISIIYDEEANEPKNQNSTIGYLAKFKNIDVCTLRGRASKNGKYFGIMHMKLAIIDQQEMFIGSANWSKNAFENSYETLFITDNKEIIQKSNDYFKEMKQDCKSY